MKIQPIAVSILLFISILMMTVSCEKQETKWKGSIEIENGVTVVKNPKEPMYQEDVISIEEELSIGDIEGDENYMFSDISHVTVDNEERIYILDRRESHVKVFGQNGKYIRTIGKKGQGPGELASPIFVYFSWGELLVTQFERLSFFSPEGELLRIVPTKKERFLRAKCDSQRNIIATAYILDPENPGYALKKFDSEFNLIKEIKKVSFQRKPGQVILFSRNLYMTVDHEDNIIFGFVKVGDDYELKIFNPEGVLVKKIIKEYDPVEVTEEDKKEITQQAPPQIKYQFPKYYPPYTRFVPDEMGRLYVQTRERGEGFKVYYHDVFDQDGRYLIKVPLRQYPLVFQNSKLYSIEENEDGYKFVKRYKVTWTI